MGKHEGWNGTKWRGRGFGVRGGLDAAAERVFPGTGERK